MCLWHMVIISVFSYGFLIESSTHHLPATCHRPIPVSRCCFIQYVPTPLPAYT